MSKIAELFFLAAVFAPLALMAVAIVHSYRRPPAPRAKRRAF